jgi:hypothetical protein
MPRVHIVYIIINRFFETAVTLLNLYQLKLACCYRYTESLNCLIYAEHCKISPFPHYYH